MNRRLLTRKWGLITLATVIVILACVRLGFWQMDRYEQRVERNAATKSALAKPAVPLEDLAADEPGGDANQWRAVTVTGRYDADQQLLLRYRKLDGQAGVHVLTPLITDRGDALVVDRGFIAADRNSPRTAVPEAPEPPDGEVTVVARLRASEGSRGLGAAEETGSIRYVNLAELEAQLPYSVYGQWAELIEQEPAPSGDLQLIPAPELSTGPSFYYAIQWWMFALIGVVGYVILARGEAHGEGAGRGDGGNGAGRGDGGNGARRGDRGEGTGRGDRGEGTGRGDRSEPARTASSRENRPSRA